MEQSFDFFDMIGFIGMPMKVSAQQTFSPGRLVLIETFFTHNVKSDDNVACETLRDFLRRDSNGKTMRTRPRQFGINAL